MPRFLCPRCGQSEIVPLAYSEAIIDELAEKQRLVLVEMRDNQGIIPMSCNSCEPIRLQEQPIPIGSPVLVKSECRSDFERLNNHLRGRAYDAGSIKQVYQLFDGACVYLAVDAHGDEACVVPQWITEPPCPQQP